MPAPRPMSAWPRQRPRWPTLLALTLIVAAVHGWLLTPRKTFAPRPPAWQVRWIAPEPAATVTAHPAAINDPRTTAPMQNHLHKSPAQPIRAAPHAPHRSPSQTQTETRNRTPPTPPQAAAPQPPSPTTAVSISVTGANTTPLHVPDPIRLPPTVTLHYQVSGTKNGKPVEGESTLNWLPDGPLYHAAWELTSPQLGHRSLTSVGALQASGLAPDRYGDRQRSEQAVHFDPEGRRVRFSNNTPDAPWLPGMQDRLSALFQLAALLAAAPDRYPSGTAIRLPTVGTRGTTDALWQVEGEETLDIAGQVVPCVKLRHDPDGPYGNRTELWLDRSRNYLPARLRDTRFNGDAIDQTLRAWPERD